MGTNRETTSTYMFVAWSPICFCFLSTYTPDDDHNAMQPDIHPEFLKDPLDMVILRSQPPVFSDDSNRECKLD
jgi:hypothetical protein